MLRFDKPINIVRCQAGNTLPRNCARLHANIELAELPTQAEIHIFAAPASNG